MNHFFWLNKEDREREPMIQYLDCENPNSALLPYVLSPLLTKYKGPNDVYGHLRLMTNLKNHIIGHTGTRLPKRKRSQTIP
jgi:LPS sulfotransferase NodH